MTAPRSHAEIVELLGAYALDALDGEEYEIVELHLRECPQCRAEVADFREVAALIGHGGAPAPERVWERIAEGVGGQP
jgi:anti-sigma factor RsiW